MNVPQTDTPPDQDHGAAFSLDVELASLRAWPGVERRTILGWEARFAGGHTKRANSASPLPAADGANPAAPALPPAELARRIDACEGAYARQGQPAIFKIPDFLDPKVDDHLRMRGYVQADPTLVLVRSLEGLSQAEPVPCMPLGVWLAAWAECNGAATPPPAHRMILEAQLDRAVFACVPCGETPVSCGLGVADGPLFGIFDIHTREDARRSGHATKLVQGLLAAGRRGGAATCYLQVVESNDPARALYASLGFTELYSYWYRVQPPA